MQKGRVACEMNTGEELISTELVFRNMLGPLNPAEAVALLSCLVFQVIDWIACRRIVETSIYMNIDQLFPSDDILAMSSASWVDDVDALIGATNLNLLNGRDFVV